MIAQPCPLIEVFSDLADLRKSRGKRHPLSALLALACCARLCGYRSDSAIAAWGRNYGTEIAHALGFTHNTPCAATLHPILRCIDREAFEAKVGAWAHSMVATVPAAPEAPAIAIAVDGKTLRGSKKQGAPETQLVSVLAPRAGLTLTQPAVAAKTNEIKEVETVLGQIVLTGRLVTMDALRTPRQVAQTIVEAGGDYVMIVKDNQPQLKADIALVCTLPPVGDRQESVRTVDSGPGRIEPRNLTTSAALVGYSDWPGLAQGCEGGRHGMTQNTAIERVEVVYGVTRLRPERAPPHRLLELVRGHWGIEHKSHWVRDVTFDADRSQVRCGKIPHMMAA